MPKTMLAVFCSLAAPSEPLPLEPSLPLALKQQLQEAEWDAGERKEEVALIAAGRGSEGEGLYGSPLLDFSITQGAETRGKPPNAEVPRRTVQVDTEEMARLRSKIEEEDLEQLQTLSRDSDLPWQPPRPRTDSGPTLPFELSNI